jgi:hypothetical protein
MSSTHPFVSSLEVERKIHPTAILKAHLDPNVAHAHDYEYNPPESRVTGLQPMNILTFDRLPDRIIRDVYLDINNSLSRKGLWIRYRESSNVRSPEFPFFLESSSAREWEAKIRLGGDYRDSQCK